MNIIDISQDLLKAKVYPGDPEPRIHQVMRIEQGDPCNLSALYACVHTGTHADAPLHFVEGGKSIDEMPLEPYIGSCKVIDFAQGPITGSDIDNINLHKCERLLIKGCGKAFVTPSAAYEFSALGIKLIGIDMASVAGTDSSNQSPTHKALLENNIAILEGLNLSEVTAGEYFLFAPPVKLGGRDGAPVRAVLISDYIFWGGKS